MLFVGKGHWCNYIYGEVHSIFNTLQNGGLSKIEDIPNWYFVTLNWIQLFSFRTWVRTSIWNTNWECQKVEKTNCSPIGLLETYMFLSPLRCTFQTNE